MSRTKVLILDQTVSDNSEGNLTEKINNLLESKVSVVYIHTHIAV